MKAINLKVGNVLSATDATVMSEPYLLNPAGSRNLPYKKTDIAITVRYANGKESTRIWNKNTEIKICSL